MQASPKTIVAFLAVTSWAALAAEVMPIAQQNAMVQKYCAVCHDDAHRNGGLSLQHFDAATPDPSLVAMLISKMKDGAFGAAGLPGQRDQEQALIEALIPKATGAEEWTIERAAATVTASIVQKVASTEHRGEPDLYRLTIECQAGRHEAEMQLSWSPGVPEFDRIMSVAADGKPLLTWKVEGKEKMGNGSDAGSGPGSVILYGTNNPKALNSSMPLPVQTLIIDDLFPKQTVVFPFARLPQTARQELSSCFGR
jgi:hypothetical protein